MVTFTTAQLDWLRAACAQKAEQLREESESYPVGIAKGITALREEQYRDLSDTLNKIILGDELRIAIRR